MFPNFLEGPFLFLYAVVLICTTGLAPACLLLKGDLVWAACPFLGIATALLVLGNLLYLNVPIGTSAIPLALLSVVAVVFVARRRIIPPLPRGPIIYAVIAAIIAGFGYFSIGRHYTAFHWTDQYTNISTAQFLIDKPFSTDLPDVENTPYMLTPIKNKSFRIGTQAIIAYVASTLGTNAKTVYGSISVLTTFLIFLAIWTGAGSLGLSGWRQAVATLFAALLPGFAIIPLECFLPQSLAVCFLIFWPVALDHLSIRPSVKMIIFSTLFLVAPIYIYPEFFPLFTLVAVFSMLWQSIISRKLGPVLALIPIFIIPLATNPHATEVAWRHISGVGMSNVLSVIYPFAFNIEGIQRIWFGELFLTGSPFIVTISSTIAVLFVAIAIISLISVVIRFKSTYSVGIIVILFLPLLPLVVSLKSPMPYQFYKILLSTTPVWALGAVILLTQKSQHKKLFLFRFCLLFAVFALSIAATFGLVHKTIAGGARTNFDFSIRENQNVLYDKLEQFKGKNVLYVPTGGFSPDLDVAYVAYHARHSRLWLLNHQLDRYLTSPYPPDNMPSFLAGDIDGDQKCDLILFNAESGHWWISRASGNFTRLEEFVGGFGVQSYNLEIPLLADVNGDGKADGAIYNPEMGWWVAFSNGQHFETPKKWAPEVQASTKCKIPFIPFLADVNGDKKADATLFDATTGQWISALSDGTQFKPFILWSIKPTPKGGIPFLSDVNGDRKADAILFDMATGQWMVGLSSGEQFQKFIPWSLESTPKSGIPFLADVNGNEKADAIIFDTTTGQWMVGLSDGTKFKPFTPWKSTGGPVISGKQIVFADINGDKKKEVVVFDAKAYKILSAVLYDGTELRWTHSATLPTVSPFPFIDMSKMPRDTIIVKGPLPPNESSDRITLSNDLTKNISTALYYTGGRLLGTNGMIHYRIGDQWPRLSIFLYSSFDQSRTVNLEFRVERNSTITENCMTIRLITSPEVSSITNFPVRLPDGLVNFPILLHKGLTILMIESPLRQNWQTALSISNISIQSASYQ